MNELPSVGARIRFRRPYWFDPQQVLGSLSMGTIESVAVDPGETEPTILVRLDKPHHGLPDDPFLMSFYPQCGPQENEETGEDLNVIQQFHYYCDVITDPKAAAV